MPNTEYRHISWPEGVVRHPPSWDFDQWTVSPTDWSAIFDFMVTKNVKTVIEFGSGLSSVLMSQVADVVTLENSKVHAEKSRKNSLLGSKLTVLDWDGRVLPTLPRPKYDMAFIDGPWFDVPQHGRDRERAFWHVNHLSDVVFVHDALRDGEMRLQLWYLAPHYNLHGFYRSDDNRSMSLWGRTPLTTPETVV